MSAPAFLEHAKNWEPIGRRLSSELHLRWAWDSLYYAVTARVPLEDLERVAGVLRAALSTEWTAETLARAPRDVRDLCSWTGGLEGEQRLFHTSIGATALFATLWPWTVGAAGTLRIGCWQPNDRIADRPPLGELVRGWFAI